MLSRAARPMVVHESDRQAMRLAAPWPDALFRVLWVLVGAGCCVLVSGFEPNLLEEGIELHVAQRVAHGERLYRDVLVFTGPFPFELLALLFRWFGEEIWVARSVVVLLHALTSGAAFAIASAARPGALAHAATAAVATAPLLLFPLFGIYYYTTIAFHLSVLAAFAALRGLHSDSWAALAGVLVATVALCKQTVGLSLAVCLALGLVAAARGAGRARALLGFAAGGAGTAALTIGLWAAAGTLDEAIYALISLPMSLEETYDSPFLNLWPLGEFSQVAAGSQTFYLPYFYMLVQGIFVEPSWRAIFATQALFALPLLALVATAARLALRPLPPAFVLHTALTMAWFSNLVPRSDWGHLAHVLPLAVAQLCIVTPEAPQRAKWRHATTSLLAALVMLSISAGSVLAAWLIHGVADPRPLGSRVALRPVSAPLRETHVRSVIDFLGSHAQPGEAIFVARAEPLLYFATDTRNPTPYPGVFPAIREEQQRVILEALERVRFVVMSDVDQPAMTYYRDELPEVQAYLERFFHPSEPFRDGEFHWLGVLERGADRGVTAIDLVKLAPHGRAFTRSDDGEIEPAPALAERLGTRRNRRPLGFHLGEAGGGIDFDIDVPDRAVFQADASLGYVFAADGILGIPPRSRILVSIGRPGEMTPIVDLKLGSGWSNRWIPVEADLSTWAGQRVTLRIEVIASRRLARTRVDRIGYLGSPRIARRAADEGA